MAKKSPKNITVAAFPALVTLGKLTRGKAPIEVLREMDNLENKHGKKAMFNGYKLYRKASGKAFPESREEKVAFGSGFCNTFARLESLGLIQADESNKTCAPNERSWRLTPESRMALRYL